MTLDADITVGNSGFFTINETVIDPAGDDALSITSDGNGVLEIGANVSVEGDLDVKNTVNFTVKGCDTLTITVFSSILTSAK